MQTVPCPPASLDIRHIDFTRPAMAPQERRKNTIRASFPFCINSSICRKEKREGSRKARQGEIECALVCARSSRTLHEHARKHADGTIRSCLLRLFENSCLNSFIEQLLHVYTLPISLPKERRKTMGAAEGCEAVCGQDRVPPDVSTIRMINAPRMCQYTDLLSLEVAPFRLLRMFFLRMFLRVGQRDRFIFMLAASFEFQQCLIYSFHTSMFYSAVCLLRCTCIRSVDETEREREAGVGEGGGGRG
jgi:hypothetical protein